MEEPKQQATPPNAWTTEQAAEFLGVSVEFLRRDRVTKRRIPFCKIGRRCVYDPRVVIAYRERCTVGGQ
jgi:excisionase family DNA binding protein